MPTNAQQSQHTCMYTTTGTCISEIQNTGKHLIHDKKGYILMLNIYIALKVYARYHCLDSIDF